MPEGRLRRAFVALQVAPDDSPPVSVVDDPFEKRFHGDRKGVPEDVESWSKSV